MSEQEKIQLFEDQKIRTAWDTEKEEWYFSVTDVISVLTGQQTARGASNYWAKLKQRLKEEGADELLTNCQQLKMTASDGKRRATDVATTEQLLRIIQSVPSPRSLSPRQKPNPYEHGLPRLAASASRKPLTRNRPLTVLWKPISERAMIPTGCTKGSFPSVSAMSSPTNGRGAEWKRAGNLLS